MKQIMINIYPVPIELEAKIYTKEEAEFAHAIAKEVRGLQLGEETILTSFLMNADTKNDKIRSIIIENFGTKMLEKMNLLKRMGTVAFPESQKRIMGLRKLFIELTDDLTLIFIKLAERLAALKVAEQSRDATIIDLSEECLYLYSPIAHRLGIRRIYNQMEDIAFKHLFPDEFRKLNRQIERKREEYERKLLKMKANIEELLQKNKIEAQLQYRVKRLYSIFRKIRNQRIDVSQIYDLMALRIITKSTENCYLTLGVIHSNWVPIEGRFRDWVTFPKANGYRSIQTTVLTRKGNKYEVQIRTEEMHQEAEYGSAAHWSYKEGSNTADKWITRLQEFLENDEYFERPHEVLDMLNQEMKRDYISVLTPNGEIISLPEKSTPVDFAFSVHTDLGYKTTGAHVNGKFVKLNTALKSGDICDIVSLKSGTPSRDWLNFVKTSRARSKILRWFKKHEEEHFIIEGKKQFDKLKKGYAAKLDKLEDQELTFRRNIAKSGFKTQDDLFYAIGSKGLKCTLSLLKKLYPDAFVKPAREKTQTSEKSAKQAQSPRVKVDGLKNIETSLAKCCNPIKGEPIIAYVTKRTGIKIHSRSCALYKSGKLAEENLKTAAWEMTESLQTVRLKLYGYSFNDMLKDFVDIADSHKLKVESTERINVGKSYQGMKAELTIKDIGQLHNFTNKLRSANSIENVRQL